MKLDALAQYTELREQLFGEKSQLEARLAELNQVLGFEGGLPAASATGQSVAASKPKRGRRAANTMSMREAVLQALSKGPLARKGIVKAVEDLGYVFKTSDPLNSIGSILYGKNTPVKNKDGKYFLAGAAPAPAAEVKGNVAPEPKRLKKRTMSSEVKAKIAAAQRARWTKVRQAK
jgi:hypothetical protein